MDSLDSELRPGHPNYSPDNPLAYSQQLVAQREIAFSRMILTGGRSGESSVSKVVKLPTQNKLSPKVVESTSPQPTQTVEQPSP